MAISHKMSEENKIARMESLAAPKPKYEIYPRIRFFRDVEGYFEDIYTILI